MAVFFWENFCDMAVFSFVIWRYSFARIFMMWRFSYGVTFVMWRFSFASVATWQHLFRDVAVFGAFASGFAASERFTERFKPAVVERSGSTPI